MREKKQSFCVVQLNIKRKSPALPSYCAHIVHVKCLILTVILYGEVLWWFITQQLFMRGPDSYWD